MKIIPSVFVLFAVLTVVHSANSIWGTSNSNDTVIYKNNIYYPAMLNAAQTFFFSIPESYKSNSRVISSIQLEDQFKNNTGPTNSLLTGGPNWTYATVRMVTQRSYGLNITVTVYGRYVM